MTTPRTLLVMAGGTGGHVFPGLAVAHALRDAGWKIVWLGNRAGMEATLVPKHDIPMEFIQFGGLRGKGLLTKFLLPLNLLRAFWQSIGALRRVRPDVVLGMGGYITFPAGMMASLLGRPLVLHEQNSIAGLANKVLAKVADRVLCAFPDTLPGSEWTGNPVRDEVTQLLAPEARYDQRTGPLRVLVVGGSLGAAALNDVVPKAIALLPQDKRPIVTHQAGVKQIDTLRANYAQAQVSAETLPFIDDMAQAYADADLVICRAGAMTVSEVAAAGVAALFVPFPHAVDDHQTTNAMFLSKQGAALLVQQNELTAQGLAKLIAGLSRPQLKDMARMARALAKPEATRRVAEICREMAGD